MGYLERSKDPRDHASHRTESPSIPPANAPYPRHVDGFAHEAGASPLQRAQRPMPAAGHPYVPAVFGPTPESKQKGGHKQTADTNTQGGGAAVAVSNAMNNKWQESLPSGPRRGQPLPRPGSYLLHSWRILTLSSPWETQQCPPCTLSPIGRASVLSTNVPVHAYGGCILLCRRCRCTKY